LKALGNVRNQIRKSGDFVNRRGVAALCFRGYERRMENALDRIEAQLTVLQWMAKAKSRSACSNVGPRPPSFTSNTTAGCAGFVIKMTAGMIAAFPPRS
jgi:hypothetical protein